MMIFRLALVFAAPIWLLVHLWRWPGLEPGQRILGSCLILLVSQMHGINALFFGGMSGPDMSNWLLLPMAALYVTMHLLFYCAVAWDGFRLLRRLMDRRRRRREALRRRLAQNFQRFSPERRDFLRRGAAFLAYNRYAKVACGLSLGAAGFGVSQGVALPRLHRMDLFLPNLPPDLEGCRIAHLTDIHVGPLTSVAWVRNLTARVNEAAPDLICLTGDLTDGLPRFQAAGGGDRARAFCELEGLVAPLGIFACTGNHEYYSDYTAWMALYAQVGIRMLHNRAQVLERGAAKLCLIGLNDILLEQRFGARPPDLPGIMAGLPGPEAGGLRVVLAHRPFVAWESAEAGADVQLSGHTHGGQCFGMDALVALFNQGFVRGWYRVAGMPLYVSHGAGLWSGYPVRLGVPAEIAVITLKQGPAEPMTEAREFLRRERAG